MATGERRPTPKQVDEVMRRTGTDRVNAEFIAAINLGLVDGDVVPAPTAAGDAAAAVVAKARAEYPGFDADRAAYGLAAALYNAGFAAGWEAAKAETPGGGK